MWVIPRCLLILNTLNKQRHTQVFQIFILRDVTNKTSVHVQWLLTAQEMLISCMLPNKGLAFGGSSNFSEAGAVEKGGNRRPGA